MHSRQEVYSAQQTGSGTTTVRKKCKAGRQFSRTDKRGTVDSERQFTGDRKTKTQQTENINTQQTGIQIIQSIQKYRYTADWNANIIHRMQEYKYTTDRNTVTQ